MSQFDQSAIEEDNIHIPSFSSPLSPTVSNIEVAKQGVSKIQA
jgi:hypothetical protein